MDSDGAKIKVRESSKAAVKTLIKAIKKDIPKVDYEKAKALVEGKVDSIVTCKTLLIGIASKLDDRTNFWLRNTIVELIEASEKTFDFLLDALEEAIPEEYNENKLRAISQGKLRAFEYTHQITEGIEELEKVLKADGSDVVLSNKKISSGRIEKMAQSMGYGGKKHIL